MKKLLILLMLLPFPLIGQEAADSVPVIIYDRADMIVDIIPNGYRGWRGDTITFRAIVTDGPTGDTLPAIVTWEERTGNVTIDPNTGFATFNNRGRYDVIANVERLLDLEIGIVEEDGSVSPIGPEGFTMSVGETRQLCAFMIGEYGTVLFPGSPEPGSFCDVDTYNGFPVRALSPSQDLDRAYDFLLDRIDQSGLRMLLG